MPSTTSTSSFGGEAEENETKPFAKEEGKVIDSALRKKSDDSSKAPQATSLNLIANLVTAGLGTGVFTLPWSTAGASIFPALLIIALVLSLNAWTIAILVEAAERHQVFDLGNLLARLPGHLGKVSQIVCNAVLAFSMYLVLVGYIVVIADCFQTSIPAGAHQRTYIVVVASVVILPLCFLDQRRLSFTSVLAVVANAVIFGQLFAQFGIEEAQGTRPPICYLGMSQGVIAMVSAMMQTVVIQMCVLPMYKELKDRTPAKMNRITVVSFSALFLICAGYSVAGYLTFGQGVSSNILLDLPSNHWGHASRLSAAAAVAAVFPIVLGPMVAPIASEVSENRLSKNLLGMAICGIVFAVMCAALYVHDLGFLNVVNGAMSMGVFVALVPSLVGLHLLGPRSTVVSWRIGMYTLAVVGFLFSIVGMVMTDNYATAAKWACMFPTFKS